MLQPEKKKKIPSRRYRRILLVVMILAVLVAGFMSVVMQKMTRPALIVYYDTGGDEIMVLPSDGSASPVNVSNHPAGDLNPNWLPDGSSIAFHSERNQQPYHLRDIYRVNPDGSNLQYFTVQAGAYDINYSPDGTSILFTAQFGRNAEIMQVDANGLNPVNLTNTPDRDEVFPVWSPDGTQITFVCDYKTLCIMNADGSARRELTASGGTDSRWSPDGSQIAFFCLRSKLCIIQPDGSGERVIAERYSTNGYEWSPDGTRLAIVIAESDQDYDIYVMNADGSNPVNLSRHLAIDTEPEWSPDGSQIVFVSHRDTVGTDTRSELYIINPDGSNLRRMTYRSSYKYEPQWQPNPCGAWDIWCYLTRP